MFLVLLGVAIYAIWFQPSTTKYVPVDKPGTALLKHFTVLYPNGALVVPHGSVAYALVIKKGIVKLSGAPKSLELKLKGAANPYEMTVIVGPPGVKDPLG